MTLLDLFTGNFTWWQLLREIGPLVFAASSAFFAGYSYGRGKEFQVNMDRIQWLELRFLSTYPAESQLIDPAIPPTTEAPQ